MLTPNVKHQEEIDALSAAMLRGDIELLEAMAKQATGKDWNITPETIRRVIDALKEEKKPCAHF